MDLSNRPLAPNPYDQLPPVPTFSLWSNGFDEGEPIPNKFAGVGKNVSPHLSWSGFPAGTKSFVVNCFDPDAPTPAGFWHWTVAGISPEVTELAQGVGAGDEQLPAGAFHVRNDGSQRAYMGPYPPEADRPHRYYFALHALDVADLSVTKNDSPTMVAFQALFHTIARATLMGTFQR